MGSNFSEHICCVTCGTCKKGEAEEANETSETKPILRMSGETSMCTDTQPSPPPLEASKQGSEEVQSLSQDRRPSPDAGEENWETCSAADPVGTTKEWETAWDCPDFLVAPADGQTKGEGDVLTQSDNQQEREKVGNAEEKIEVTLVPCASEAQPVTQVALDAADTEQPREQVEAGGEGSPSAGITLQERNILNFAEMTSEMAAGQGCEIKPPAETADSLIGGSVPRCPVRTAEETETCLSAEQEADMGRAKLAETSPRSAERAELTSPVESASLLTVQATQEAREAADPLEAVANGVAELSSTLAMPWDSLYPGGESLALANQLLDFLQRETQSSVPATQETESRCCAEPAELSEVLCQPSDGILGDLEDEESRECDAETAAGEAEPQHRIMQQTIKPLSCVLIPVQREAEFLSVAPSLPEVLGSSGETEAEHAEA